MMPIDIANPAFTFPPPAILVGDELYFIADSQRGLKWPVWRPQASGPVEGGAGIPQQCALAWNEGGIAGTSQPAQRLPATQPAAASAPAPAAEKKTDGVAFDSSGLAAACAVRQRQVNRQGQQNPGQAGLLKAGQDLAEQGKPCQQGNGHEQATAEAPG